MNNANFNKTNPYSRKAAGLIFLLSGFILLSQTLGLDTGIPDWIVSWPVLLIVIGIYSGIKHHFRRAGAYFMIAIGSAFLAERVVPGIHFHQLIFPVLILAAGLHLMFGRKMIMVSGQTNFHDTGSKTDERSKNDSLFRG